jgi:hypothetical protein
VPASLSALYEVNITAVTTNHDGVPSTYRFTAAAAQLDHRSELDLDIPIKSLTKNITISVTAKTKTLRSKEISLSRVEAINLNIY